MVSGELERQTVLGAKPAGFEVCRDLTDYYKKDDMQGYIARLLCLLPAWVTGRLSAGAEREIRRLYMHNTTCGAYRYNSLERLLYWGSARPILFSFAIALLSYGIAWLLTTERLFTAGILPAPVFDGHFDLPAFVGVPWTVQATMLALVYPIVISFVAIMLERKAKASAFLRAYIVDSALIPAGASSLALTLVLSAEYFNAIYGAGDAVSFGVTFNWAWLTLNVLLTGFFLSKTVDFLREDTQHEAFTRMAINASLYQELLAALTQSRYLERADDVTEHRNGGPKKYPRVTTYPWPDGVIQVTRRLGERERLVDVHMNMVNIAVWLWRRRANRGMKLGRHKEPAIGFPAPVGLETSGRAKLCVVSGGPNLRRIERALIGCAFVYRSGPDRGKAPSTIEMLPELAAEVEVRAEAGDYRASYEAFKRFYTLHRLLVKACAVTREGEVESAALLARNVYSFGANTFSKTWIQQYRDLNRLAVRILDKDQRLLSALSSVAHQFVRDIPARPEGISQDVLLVSTNLAYELGSWWMHQAQVHIASSTVLQDGLLPSAIQRPYEQAVIQLIGGWGQVSIELPKAEEVSPEVYWDCLCSRARLYASHIEMSAKMLLDAIARGDEAASVWLCDSFLKWTGGSRNFELDVKDISWSPDFGKVGMSIVQRTWAEIQDQFIVSTPALSAKVAEQIVSLAILRYWESMRFAVVLLILENARNEVTAISRECRLVAALLSATPLKGGSSVNAKPLLSADAIWVTMLRASFGDLGLVSRLDGFTEKLKWDEQRAEVPGWHYSWSGSPGVVSSKYLQFLQLLLIAEAAPVRRAVNDQLASAKRFVESLWRDTDKLSEVANFIGNVEREFSSPTMTQKLQAVRAIRELLLQQGPLWKSGVRAMKHARRIREVARHERTLTMRCTEVDSTKVKKLSSSVVSRALMSGPSSGGLITSVVLVRSTASKPVTLSFECEKQSLARYSERELGDGFVREWADYFWSNLADWALAQYLTSDRAKQFDLTAVLPESNPSDETVVAALRAVVDEAEVLRSKGVSPVIVVATQAWSFFRAPFGWEAHDTKQLPPDLQLSQGVPHHGHLPVAQLNGIPVHEFGFNNVSCYVGSLSEVSTLSVEGSSLESAASVSWKSKTDERVLVTLALKAQMGGGHASTCASKT